MFSPIFSLIFVVYASAKSNNDSAIAVGKIYNISNIEPVNITKDGRTYYFKYNSNNNQFRIYNRINANGQMGQNNSITGSKKKMLSTKMERSNNMNELRKFEAFLDDEWNYSNRITLNTTELPKQIHPFLYNSLLEKLTKNNSENLPDVTKVIFNSKKNGSTILHFTLGKTQHNHVIDNGELHFYWTVPENSDFYKNSCVLRLYEVDNQKNDTLATANPDTHKLINVIYSSKAQTGWQMFRISRRSIETWANLTENLKLIISISQANQVNSTTVFDDAPNDAKLRTFLILKIKDTERNEVVEIAPKTNFTNIYNTASARYCSRKEFYIDFRKLHWTKFVIAPEGFMAYECFGKCTKHNIENFSNHLKMLSTFQDVDKKIRAACCVPTKFFALPIMFYDEFGNVVIKIYRNMIVAGCGCR